MLPQFQVYCPFVQSALSGVLGGLCLMCSLFTWGAGRLCAKPGLQLSWCLLQQRVGGSPSAFASELVPYGHGAGCANSGI